MAHLDGGGPAAQTALAAFVFVDKYTGPLGQAALDTAAVALLQANALPARPPPGQRARAAVPAAFLISLRAASFKYERPLWEMLLLSEEAWPLPFTPVVLTLLGAVSAGVVHALLAHASAEVGGAARTAEAPAVAHRRTREQSRESGV